MVQQTKKGNVANMNEVVPTSGNQISRDKGKSKVSIPTTPPPQPSPSQPQVDSEDEDGFDFVVLEMDRASVMKSKGVAPEETATRLILTFAAPPDICFGDHMGPFRGLLQELRDHSAAAKTQTINDLFEPKQTPKIFVVVSGWEAVNDSVRTAARAIKTILQEDPLEISYIPRSAWMIATLRNKDQIKKLVAQKVVCDPMKRVLVVFRKVVKTLTPSQFFELKEMRQRKDLVKIKETLESQGVVVSRYIIVE